MAGHGQYRLTCGRVRWRLAWRRTCRIGASRWLTSRGSTHSRTLARMSAAGWSYSRNVWTRSRYAGSRRSAWRLLPLLTGEGRAHHGEILSQATRLAEAGQLLPFLDARRFTLNTIEEATLSKVVTGGTTAGTDTQSTAADSEQKRVLAVRPNR